MAFYPLRAGASEVVLLGGRWEGGSSSGATKIAPTGDAGWTIATGAGSGVYTITVTEPGYEIVGFINQIHADTRADVNLFSAVMDVDGSSTSAVLFTVYAEDGTTATDLTANQFMDFILICKHSAV